MHTNLYGAQTDTFLNVNCAANLKKKNIYVAETSSMYDWSKKKNNL